MDLVLSTSWAPWEEPVATVDEPPLHGPKLPPERNKTRPFKVNDLVMLDRESYRGKFTLCKGRIGRVTHIKNIKSTIVCYGRITQYKVEGLVPPNSMKDYTLNGETFRAHVPEVLNLLAQDLILVNDREADWEYQRCLDRLAG